MPNYRRYFQNANQVFITIVTYNRLPILISNIDIISELDGFNDTFLNKAFYEGIGVRQINYLKKYLPKEIMKKINDLLKE